MKISDITRYLEQLAPPAYQESYDNAGLLTGQPDWDCSGILVCLDAIEAVIDEAIARQCNLVVAHHPIIFKGLKKITGKNYVERTIIKAIKNDIAIYAIHTNLDNVKEGVSGKMAIRLGLQQTSILSPKEGLLKKLVTFVPRDHLSIVREAIFKAGAGHIGNYADCSFTSNGIGTFKAGQGADPFVGELGKLHQEEENRLEVIFPSFLLSSVIAALKQAHPYEEVAYDVYHLANTYQEVGSGMVGNLPQPLPEEEFLNLIKEKFNIKVIRHTPLLGKPVSKVALCGGAASFLIQAARAAGADIFITGDVKYHEFFDADNQLVIADIGHFESEQFTIDLLHEVLESKFPNFAVLKTEVNTNPLRYFVGK